MGTAGIYYVATKHIRKALDGHETEILSALNIRWREGGLHITLPLSRPCRRSPSWRWDARKRGRSALAGRVTPRRVDGRRGESSLRLRKFTLPSC